MSTMYCGWEDSMQGRGAQGTGQAHSPIEAKTYEFETPNVFVTPALFNIS